MASIYQTVLPRQNYEMTLQAVIGSKSIASERVSAVRKDVTAGRSSVSRF